MALSKSESKNYVSNIACIARILLGPCTDTLRDVLTHQITLSDLKIKLRDFIDKAYEQRECFIGLHCLIYEHHGQYSDFDIPLLYFFLRSICDIPSPQPKWGLFSSEKATSLSPNITRIYRKYRNYRYSLCGSTFEQDWKELFETVKELEEYIGSATANQDAMKKIKNSSMDPDIEHLFIAKLKQGKRVSKFERFPFSYPWTNVIPESKEEAQVSASRGIEFFLDNVWGNRLHLEKRSGIPALVSRGIDFYRRRSEGRRQVFEKELLKPGNITSKKLKELFSTFKVVFPDGVPGNKSFVREILKDDILKLESAIVSLSKGVALKPYMHSLTHEWSQVGEVIVVEVNVVYDENGDQLCVFIKDNSSDVLLKMPKDNCINVFLIRSGSIPVVSSKLIAYKTFRRAINENEIFLQHEYEDFDDMAKLIANKIFSSFCLYLDLVIHALTNDLHKLMFYNYDKPLKATDIRQMCSDVFNGIAQKYKPFGSTENWRWTLFYSHSIQKEIYSKKVQMTGADAWDTIQKVCRKTVEDLKTILSNLEDLQKNELHVNQKKEIDEWLKREVIEDKASLREYPYIIKCIAGQRDDKNVVKVYLSGGNTEEAKEAFKEKCKLAITDFEFVNIEEKIEMPKDVEKIKALEREAPEIDRSTREDLEKIIQKHTDKLYATYSNIIGIRIGRRVHGDKLEEPCIIFYCLDKSLIPFGEKKIPDTLEGWPCDVREDFIMLGRCTEYCRTTTADYPELGCSIGMPSDKSFGSVGFMFESEDSKEYGFLTAAHVAIENCQQLYRGNNLLSEHPLRNKRHDIVHPSWTDNEYNDYIVGQVIEAFYGNYTSLPGGLDFAAIKTNCKKKDKEDIEVFNEDKTISSKRVKKTGRTTGLTFGLLSNKMESICFEKPPGSENRLPFYNLYVVKKIAEEDPLFFKPGDSGSGVFVVEDGKPDKALGIGIAIGMISQETYVCKIANILKTLGLKLVRYRENSKEQTLPSTKKM